MLVIWGCGGHGRVVLDIARATGRFGECVFYADEPPSEQTINEAPVLARLPAAAAFIIAIGDNRIRQQRFEQALAAGLSPAVCIHPTAVISPYARIGAGTVIMPLSVVQTGAVIGLNCILNTASIVEHDCAVGDHVHLSPGVALGGNVSIADRAHLGVNASARPGCRIGADAIVGAGSVVIAEIPPDCTAHGVPARVHVRSNSVIR